MSFRQRLTSATAIVCLLSVDAAAQPAADEVPIEEGDEVPIESAPAEGQKPGEEKPSEQKPPEKPAEPKPEDKEKAPAAEEAIDEEDPARPPPRGKGVVWGVLRDTKLEEPLAEALVSAEGKQKGSAITDLDGRFRLELSPGVYDIRFWAELHRAEVAKAVRVEIGKVLRLDSAISPDEGAVDVVEVETEADRAAVEGQILTRQRAAAVGDSVGRAEIARTPDKNAAQAAQRVVGATVVGGRFVYVRGLGERYTNALLNGAPLPSPEPDRAAVPLDLFPTMAIDSLTIAKTFTPDVPGDFAGGSVRIETREIPSKPVFQLSLGGGYNAQSTFRERPTYPGGGMDWLGMDDGTRALPDGFPRYRLEEDLNKPDGTPVTSDDLTAAGRQINSYFSTERSTSPPDHSMSLVVGNGWKVGRDQKIGVLAAASYGRSYLLREGQILREFGLGTNEELQPQRNYRLEIGQDTVNWGTLGSITYQVHKDHRLTLLGLHSQISDNVAQVADGFDTSRSSSIHDTRLAFASRALNLLQLRGEHLFPELGRAQLDWTGWLSNAGRDEPDTRGVAWQRSQGATSNWVYLDDSYSGRHFWAEQSEDAKGGKVDWTQPFSSEESKLKLGGFLNIRERDFTSRSMALRRSVPPLQIVARTSCASEDFDQCADDLFHGDNIGDAVQLRESTLAEDAYKAELDVYAGYLMADVALAKDLRVIAGERVEVTRQTIEPYDQFNPDSPQNSGAIRSTDLLPTLASVLDFSKETKLRGSLTRTLARPQLRELAPFAYNDFFGGRFVSGNPDLKLTHITNADLRLEHFPTLKEVLAVSVFYKHFQDPIETITVASGDKGTITYQNAEGADLYGAEIEARKGLGFMSKALNDFAVIANVTVATSSIQLSGAARQYLTNSSRPMVNQSPYVLNLSLDYDAPTGTSLRLLYNVSGARIVQVGAQRLPDAYEHPRHLIDFTAAQELGKHFQFKLVAANLLNAPYVITQGKENDDDKVTSRYTTGTTVSLTATYTL